MQVELIRFSKKYQLYSLLFFLRSEEFNGMSHTFATDVVFTHGKSFQYMSVPVHTVCMESRYNNFLFDTRQFDSLLLFTPFLTV